MVVGLGAAFYILGAWLSTPEFPVATGWVGYAPLTSFFSRTRLSGGADLILWLVLIAFWVTTSSYLLRTKSSKHEQN